MLDHLQFSDYKSPTAVFDMHRVTYGISSASSFNVWTSYCLFTFLPIYRILHKSPQYFRL